MTPDPEDAEIARRARTFWAIVRRHRGALSGSWYLLDRVDDGRPVPLKKLTNFCKPVPQAMLESPLLYYDSTFWGSGTQGFLFTDTKMYLSKDSKKVKYIRLAWAKASLKLDPSFDVEGEYRDAGVLTMADQTMRVSFHDAAEAQVFQLFFKYILDPANLDFERAIGRLCDPAAESPLLAELKKLGIMNKDLTRLVGRTDASDRVLSYTKKPRLVFTNQWVVSANHGPFKRRDGTKLLVYGEGPHQVSHAAGVGHALQHAARHPNPVTIGIAVIESLLFAKHKNEEKVHKPDPPYWFTFSLVEAAALGAKGKDSFSEERLRAAEVAELYAAAGVAQVPISLPDGYTEPHS